MAVNSAIKIGEKCNLGKKYQIHKAVILAFHVNNYKTTPNTQLLLLHFFRFFSAWGADLFIVAKTSKYCIFEIPI